MRRIMLRVAYDGTAYVGWQVQDNGPTIEGELNKALKILEEMAGSSFTPIVIGGSRTDSGVHALCNVAVFDTESNIPGEKYKYALNQRLPEDIKVVSSCEVASAFHPRHTDTKKTYEYRIYNAPIPLPTKRLYAYYTYNSLDVDKMNEAAEYLLGEHDFAAFCASGAVVESTLRTIYSSSVYIEERPGTNGQHNSGRDIVIRVTGNGFLYNMVRIIAGTLIEIGRGAKEPSDMEKIIASCQRSMAGPTAPACGLTLVEYEFAQNPEFCG